MSTLSVRVSEDPHRPLGHAIVTIDGLPRTLETFVFALNRHGFAANHLGLDGWQGAECWLEPEEAWYDGASLKFVMDANLAFQLENMPYQMAVRGQGLNETAVVTFVWPLQLAIEEGTATTTRRIVVSGARVGSRPKTHVQSTPEPALPEVQNVDLPIPDLPIPEIGNNLDYENQDSLTRLTPPPLTPEDETPVHVMTDEPKPSPSDPDLIRDAAPTRRVDGRVISTPLRSQERVFGTPPDSRPNILGSEFPQKKPSPPRPISSPPITPNAEPITPQPTPRSASKRPGASDNGTRSKTGLFLGLSGVAALVATGMAGWWWFNQRSNTAAPASATQPAEHSTETQENLLKPAPEPAPAPEPVPAPEPTPAPEPVPAPEPAPATKPQSDSRRSLEEELKSQFDPTVQELEKRLRPKSP